MRKFFFPLIALAAASVLCGCSSGSGSKNSGGTGTSKFSYVEGSEPKMEKSYTEGLGWSCHITGALVNNTSSKYSYVEIQFTVYDSDDYNLGSALANMNNLGGKEKWKFDAVLLSFPETEPARFKLAEITAF